MSARNNVEVLQPLFLFLSYDVGCETSVVFKGHRTVNLYHSFNSIIVINHYLLGLKKLQ